MNSVFYLMKTNDHSILYYDNSCKICSNAKSLAFKIEPEKVKYVPLTEEVINSFSKKLHLSEDVANNVMFYSDREGNIYLGAKAFFAYLRDKKGIFSIIAIMGKFPPISWFSDKLYYCIAINRYKISSFLR